MYTKAKHPLALPVCRKQSPRIYAHKSTTAENLTVRHTAASFLSSLSLQVTSMPNVLDPQSHYKCLDRPQGFGERARGAARVRESAGLGKQRLTGADCYLLLLPDQCNGQNSSCWRHLPVNPSFERWRGTSEVVLLVTIYFELCWFPQNTALLNDTRILQYSL